MSKVKHVDKQVSMKLPELIKYQILTHCFIREQQISEAELNCLTLLGTTGQSDITEFCNLAAVKNIFKTPQTVRNCVVKFEKMKVIERTGSGRKNITLNPGMEVQTTGNILLNYKLYHIES